MDDNKHKTPRVYARSRTEDDLLIAMAAASLRDIRKTHPDTDNMSAICMAIARGYDARIVTEAHNRIERGEL